MIDDRCTGCTAPHAPDAPPDAPDAFSVPKTHKYAKGDEESEHMNNTRRDPLKPVNGRLCQIVLIIPYEVLWSNAKALAVSRDI